MTHFPGSPKVLKGGIVVADPVRSLGEARDHASVQPGYGDPLSAGRGTAASGERSEALRLTGPAIETLKLDAELDATDQLEFPDANRAILEVGLQPQIAVLEALINPTIGDLIAGNAQASAGAIEIAPAQAPLTLFVWSAQRIVPVRITDFSVTEEAFDVNLNPIRARISIGMRVLSVDDLGFPHPGGTSSSPTCVGVKPSPPVRARAN